MMIKVYECSTPRCVLINFVENNVILSSKRFKNKINQDSFEKE